MPIHGVCERLAKLDRLPLAVTGPLTRIGCIRICEPAPFGATSANRWYSPPVGNVYSSVNLPSSPRTGCSWAKCCRSAETTMK